MSSPDVQPLTSEPRWHERSAVLLLIAITLLAMGWLCANDFTWWDDQGTVHQNPWLLPPTFGTLVHYWLMPAYSLYIPVTYTVWAGVAFFAQMPKDQHGIALNPWLFHSTNVLFHLLSVLVAYRILRLLNADIFAAVCGALLFGVHPVQVEAVAWVSGLKDVLSGFLALVALWQYVSFSLSDIQGRASFTRYLLATAAFVLGMLAKPSAMALPLAALAIDRWAIGRDWRRVLPAAIGWAIIALPIAGIARWAQEASNTQLPAVWLRPLIVFDSLAFYLEKLVWPMHLAVDYGRNPTTVLAHGWCYWDWILPVGAAILLLAGARTRPVLLAAGMIFIAGCLPVLGFTPALFQFFSTTTDHYLYLSMFGPALALAWLLSVHPWLPLRFCTAAILIVLIALTIRQGAYWQNDITLFAHDTQVNPNSYVGFINLGGAYQRMDDPRRALAAFREAVRANPEYALCWSDLAASLSGAGEIDEAIASAQRSIDLQIRNPNLRLSWSQDNRLLGHLLLEKDKFAQAIPYLQTASDLDSDNRQLANELSDAKKRAATQPTQK